MQALLVLSTSNNNILWSQKKRSGWYCLQCIFLIFFILDPLGIVMSSYGSNKKNWGTSKLISLTQYRSYFSGYIIQVIVPPSVLFSNNSTTDRVGGVYNLCNVHLYFSVEMFQTHVVVCSPEVPCGEQEFPEVTKCLLYKNTLGMQNFGYNDKKRNSAECSCIWKNSMYGKTRMVKIRLTNEMHLCFLDCHGTGHSIYKESTDLSIYHGFLTFSFVSDDMKHLLIWLLQFYNMFLRKLYQRLRYLFATGNWRY